MTTPLDLAAMRRACEAATPGPWFAEDDEVHHTEEDGYTPRIADTAYGTHDAAFIALARAALPALLDALTRSEARGAYWRARSELHLLQREDAVAQYDSIDGDEPPTAKEMAEAQVAFEAAEAALREMGEEIPR